MNRPTEPAHTNAQANPFLTVGKHMRDNPLFYVGGSGFIVAVLLFTGLYGLATQSNQRDLASQYARSVLLEDPVERAEALAAISAKRSTFAPRALYLRGEALLSVMDYEGASAAFIELRETYPDFAHVPDAIEGLGFLEEDQGNTEAALEVYREVLDKWPNTPAGRRQPFNIARCLEETGNLEEAIEYYREQLGVFPGSSVSVEAQQRLFELRISHPDYFEDASNAAAVEAPQETSTELDDEAAESEEDMPAGSGSG